VRVQTSKVPPLLSPPFPSPPLSSLPLPLEVGPLNPAKLPQWQAPMILVHFQDEGTLLVAFKMHCLKHQKRPFFTFL